MAWLETSVVACKIVCLCIEIFRGRCEFLFQKTSIFLLQVVVDSFKKIVVLSVSRNELPF
ncbi:hypothetical protein NC653_023466 [Populus alba x Populus x berolinensis]|uniref:Uncharacterized protein n=1 Tax=Populus alba x Populus x berolinensis TaxID=444605 RepID=A0AAD6QAR5_9ROSI|nr:hypothetical protein NC653_023466 [Populus alba x Populus x berolinensis]